MTIISFLPTLWLILIIIGIFLEVYLKYRFYTASKFSAAVSRGAMCALAASILGANKGAYRGQLYIFALIWSFSFALSLIHKRHNKRINIEGQTNAKG